MARIHRQTIWHCHFQVQNYQYLQSHMVQIKPPQSMVAIILTETLTHVKNLFFKYMSLILISQVVWHFVITWLILARIWVNLNHVLTVQLQIIKWA